MTRWSPGTAIPATQQHVNDLSKITSSMHVNSKEAGEI